MNPYSADPFHNPRELINIVDARARPSDWNINEELALLYKAEITDIFTTDELHTIFCLHPMSIEMHTNTMSYGGITQKLNIEADVEHVQLVSAVLSNGDEVKVGRCQRCGKVYIHEEDQW